MGTALTLSVELNSWDCAQDDTWHIAERVLTVTLGTEGGSCLLPRLTMGILNSKSTSRTLEDLRVPKKIL